MEKDNHKVARIKPVKEEPKKGDYVFVSKWLDEDPNDPWAVGFFDYKKDDRFYITESSRAWRNCRKISREEGIEILNIKPKQERLSPIYDPSLEPKTFTCDICNGTGEITEEQYKKFHLLREPTKHEGKKNSDKGE